MLLNILVVILALGTAYYQFSLKPLLTKAGLWRQIEPVGNNHCTAVHELQACESTTALLLTLHTVEKPTEIVLHQPSGVLYLACSNSSTKRAWTPPLNRFDVNGTSFDDYVATYDPATGRITRLKFTKFYSKRGFSAHGMDVVQSSSNPEELFVYLINHRAPPENESAYKVGADSSVEIFKTIVGGNTLTHQYTIEDPSIICPNDIVGYPDGQSFYFTNDHGEKVGLLRELEILGRASSSVGYCHASTGCKYAMTKVQGSNGIARADNGTVYVVNSPGGVVNILERQSDNTLVVTDSVFTDRALDNVSVDSDGVLWIAGFPDAFTLMFQHFRNPSIPAPSSALRISLNTGTSSFYGEKYKVDKVFEDDGNVASGITSVVHDAQRHRLFLHGAMSPHLTICQI